MTGVLLWAVAFAASLACLVKSADVFVRSAERVGLGVGLSPFVIGISLVAVGTSLPELVAAVTSVFLGASEVAIGTAVGSNVTNILLVLGLASLFGGGIHVKHELVRVDLPFLFGSALLMALFAYDGYVWWVEGLIGLAALSVYLVYSTRTATVPATTLGAVAADATHPPEPVTRWTWLALGASLVFLQLGAHFTVESTLRLSAEIGVGSELLAASAVALGTSLPELTVTLGAARSGRSDIAVGNVIGSNIFNALGVVGAASLAGTVVAPEAITSFALPCMVGVTVLCFFVLQEHEATAFDGWLLLLLYAGFNLELFQLG